MSKIVAIVGRPGIIHRYETEPDTPPQKVSSGPNVRKHERRSTGKHEATPSGSSTGIGYRSRGPNAKERFGRRGPKTSKGKTVASMNAIQHGVYSKVETLPFEDPEEYRTHVQSFLKEHSPVGPTETYIVREIADITWKSKRLKAAYWSKVSEGLGENAAILEASEEDPPAGFDVDFWETLIPSHETFESELGEILHDDLAATRVLREHARLGEEVGLDALLHFASPRLKGDWDKHLKRTKRKLDSEKLVVEFTLFVITEFNPGVRARLENFTKKREFRALVGRETLSRVDPLAFERAESHLDRRLKNLLNMLLGLQDRRKKDD